MPQGATLRSLLSEIRLDKLSRNGDMGADPPGCFDAPEHPEQLQTMDIALDTDPQNIYILVRDYSLVIPSFEEGVALYDKSERARAELASRIRITTPDPFFNTLGVPLP